MRYGWLIFWWCGWLQAAPLLLVSGDFSPYSGASLPDGGESTRLVTTLFRDAGQRDLKVGYMPWSRGYQLTLQGDATATYPYAWTAERAKLFYYSAPIHIDRLSWFTFKGSDAVVDGLWQGLRVCIPEGWSTSHADAVIAHFAMTLQRPKGLDQCLKLLERKRVDLMPMSEAVTADASMKVFGDPHYLQVLPYFRQSDTLYLIISRRYPGGRELIEQFNTALAAARASGRYDKLVPRVDARGISK